MLAQATTVPIWGTILIALGSSAVGGVGGAFLTTMMRIRHEREEQLRLRMIEAADELSTGILQAILGIRDAVPKIGKATPALVDGDFAPDVDAAQKEVRRVVDEAHARVARVQLLFGEGTPTAEAAEACVLELRSAIAYLMEWPNPQTIEAWQCADDLVDLNRTYNREAYTAIRAARMPTLDGK